MVFMRKWTKEKNARRCFLIDKDIDEFLTFEELAEYDTLQEEMLEYRRKMAPLPIAEAKAILDKLKEEVED